MRGGCHVETYFSADESWNNGKLKCLAQHRDNNSNIVLTIVSPVAKPLVKWLLLKKYFIKSPQNYITHDRPKAKYLRNTSFHDLHKRCAYNKSTNQPASQPAKKPANRLFYQQLLHCLSVITSSLQ